MYLFPLLENEAVRTQRTTAQPPRTALQVLLLEDPEEPRTKYFPFSPVVTGFLPGLLSPHHRLIFPQTFIERLLHARPRDTAESQRGPCLHEPYLREQRQTLWSQQQVTIVHGDEDSGEERGAPGPWGPRRRACRGG